MLAVSAWLSLPVPASPVPVTLQSLAVLCVGVWLGPWRGSAAVAAYLLVGALGAPVFAGGAAGLKVLAGATGGFLLGFLPGALLAGHWTRSRIAATLVGAFVGMLAAHGVILASGWVRLAVALGPLAAWERGVLPFLVGTVLKSLAAALWVRAARRRPGPGTA